MARTKKEESPPTGTVNGEVQKPDFERAARLLLLDVKPAEEKVGEHSQTMSEAYKTIGKHCHVNTRAARIAYQLSKESDEKRDDFLRSLRGMFKAMKIRLSPDLVDKAEGRDDGEDDIIPIGERVLPKLATLEGAAIQ